MRTHLLLFLLLSPTVHAQAVRPAPATGPLIVQQPPSLPGNPVHTPAGAGASHGALPGAQKATLPPSPNKRLLPPTKEAGLWAADGAPEATFTPPQLFDVTLPTPAGLDSPEAKFLHNFCLESMANVSRAAGHHATVAAQPEPVRMCMAAVAYLGCLVGIAERSEAPGRPGVIGLPKEYSRPLRKMAGHGASMVKALCHGVTMDEDRNATIEDLLREWKSSMDATANPIQ